PGREWDEPLASGSFSIEPHVNGAAQVICATGFLRGCPHDLLLAALVDSGELVFDGRLMLAPDSTIRELTDERRTLGVAGVAGQWAYPAADGGVGREHQP